MQIITIDDDEFNELLAAWKRGLQIGRFWRNGTMQIVCATKSFVLISNGDSPDRIAIKPARTQAEAVLIALQHLDAEQSHGNRVERSDT